MLADRIRMCSYKGKGTLIDRTNPTLVVKLPYSTEGNGGRKLVRLANGWLISVVYFSKTYYFYVSKNNGNSWYQICYLSPGTAYMVDKSNISIASVGNTVFILYKTTGNNEYVSFKQFNAETVTNTNIGNSATSLDTQTAVNNVSLAINKEGTELHACWSSKNSTYPNTLNIRYCKGIINVGGTVTWGSIEQVTFYNSSVAEYALGSELTIVVRNDGHPYIVASLTNPTVSYIQGFTTAFTAKNGTFSGYTKSNWGSSVIYQLAGYAQSSPSSCIDKYGVIHVVWFGGESTNPMQRVRYSKSTNSGSTWSTSMLLYDAWTETKNPSITVNNNNEIFVVLEESSNLKVYKSLNGTYWSKLDFNLYYGQSPSTLLDNNFKFELPLTITQIGQYSSTDPSTVKFFGKWDE
ncbi:MAG: hypothetical protein TIS_01563 [Tissierella sp.]